MSKKYLRELFNQRHTKCQFCERSIINGVSDGGVFRSRVKALFHPRPWTSQAQCLHKLNNRKWKRFTQEFTNMAEEFEELERLRERLEEERLNARRARRNVRRLYNKYEAQTIKIEEQLSHPERDIPEDMLVEVLQDSTEDQGYIDSTIQQ